MKNETQWPLAIKKEYFSNGKKKTQWPLDVAERQKGACVIIYHLIFEHLGFR